MAVAAVAAVAAMFGVRAVPVFVSASVILEMAAVAAVAAAALAAAAAVWEQSVATAGVANQREGPTVVGVMAVGRAVARRAAPPAGAGV